MIYKMLFHGKGATVHAGSYVASPEDTLSDTICLNTFTFNELQATRRLQSDWVRHCTFTNTMKCAIEKGNLDNVRWIWKQNEKWSAYVDVDVYFTLATRNGHFNLLKWLHDSKCPEGVYKDPDMGYDTNAFSMAATFGSLTIMRWLKDNGYCWDQYTFAHASSEGSLENLKWLKEDGCSWNEKAGYNMVVHGDFDNIVWAKANGITFDADSYIAAAKTGNMKIMKWLKENDVPMNEKCFAMAAEQGNIKMMQWLKWNNCPWSEKTYQEAVDHGSRILKWLTNNGCPRSSSARRTTMIVS